MSAPQLAATATEYDDVWPESGSATLEVYREDVAAEPRDFVLSVLVTENGGAYTGNTALWVFTFTARLVR